PLTCACACPYRHHAHSSHPLIFVLMHTPPPTSTLFPYTTLFRSPRPCRWCPHEDPCHRLLWELRGPARRRLQLPDRARGRGRVHLAAADGPRIRSLRAPADDHRPHRAGRSDRLPPAPGPLPRPDGAGSLLGLPLPD